MMTDSNFIGTLPGIEESRRIFQAAASWTPSSCRSGSIDIIHTTNIGIDTNRWLR